MAGMHWLISGVGRSGTTMAYSALLSAARTQDPDTLGRYEPLLWGEATWDRYPNQIGSVFSRTDALSARGLFAHTQAPLFLEGSNKVFDPFVAETFPSDRNVVAKIIRGAGRLSAFLQQDPNLKIVHLVRNPLDVVNSSLHYFSFFGGEFHPSDEPRFNVEAARQYPEKFRSTEGLTEAQKAFEWWHMMNEAALASAKRFSRRVKVVAYEYLMADVPAVLAEMVEFLGGSADDLVSWSPDETVGPVTKSLALRSGDRDALMPYLDVYLADTRIFNSRKNRIDRAATKEKLVEKYSACKTGPAFSSPIDPTFSPTKVRTLATQAKYEAEASRSAGAKQAETIAHSVADKNKAELETLRNKLGELLEAQTSQTGEQTAKLQSVLDALNTSRHEDAARIIDEIQKQSDAVARLKQDMPAYFAKSEGQIDERLGERIAVLRSIVESGFTSQGELTRSQLEAIKFALDKYFSSQNETIKSLLGERDADREKLTTELGKRGDEIVALRAEFNRKDASLHELQVQLAEARAETGQVRADIAQDMKALRQLNDRLKDRIKALQDQHKTHEDTLAKMRMEKRETGEKLRRTEQRLKTVAGEREHYRKQLMETSAALSPRLKTVLSLRPLRYILNQRRRVKTGMVEIDADGIAQPRKHS